MVYVPGGQRLGDARIKALSSIIIGCQMKRPGTVSGYQVHVGIDGGLQIYLDLAAHQAVYGEGVVANISRRPPGGLAVSGYSGVGDAGHRRGDVDRVADAKPVVPGPARSIGGGGYGV
jgi:hypothetical protein